jgi:predicted phage terminase large subunit-like protein
MPKPPFSNDVQFPDDTLEVLTRNHFATFVRRTFQTLNPGVELHWAPYLDFLCAKLEDLAMGRTKRLIVMIPPRHLKSCCANVALTAFFLGHFPEKDIMSVSYSGELAKGFGEDVRKVMLTDWYQAAFDTRLASARAPANALKTTRGGVRRATSIDGTATGVGADLLIFDDPQKPGEILSDAVRSSTNHSYENTFLSRRNDPNTCGVLVIMQRLHEDDFVGHVTSLEDDWDIVRLPAIAEEDEAVDFVTGLGSRAYLRPEGAPLNPARISLDELEKSRAALGEAVWAAQYMQRPSPAGGGLVKKTWFRRYQERPPRFDRVFQSWDTANKVEQWSDYSVCTTWGILGKEIYLLDVFRRRLLYPELRPEVVRLAEFWGAEEVFIEDRASGVQLVQDLTHNGFQRARPVKSEQDKKTRMANQTALIENGRVFLPEQAPWLEEYLHELVMFPNGKYDDQVDSTSQALAEVNFRFRPGMNVYEYYRQLNEPQKPNVERILRVKGPESVSHVTIEASAYAAQPDGYFHMSAPHAIEHGKRWNWELIDQP